MGGSASGYVGAVYIYTRGGRSAHDLELLRQSWGI